jgi:hypothetical protein
MKNMLYEGNTTQIAFGSGSAFLIRIRIQEIQINADPDPKHWKT